MSPSTNTALTAFGSAVIILGACAIWNFIAGLASPVDVIESVGGAVAAANGTLALDTLQLLTLGDLVRQDPDFLNGLQDGITKALQLQEIIANGQLVLPEGLTLDDIGASEVLVLLEEYLAQHAPQDKAIQAVVEVVENASMEPGDAGGPHVHVRFHVVE